jgi:CRP-like cAMP-binding protein/Fe-S-cluster-containing dehydrogenase component/ferredoxin
MTTAATATTTAAAPPKAPAKMVTLKIDGQSVSVPEGTSVYDAARQAGIYIPVLCHKENLAPVGVCRACVCEVKGARVYAASCMRAVEDNMEVSTTNPKLDAARATVVELLLSDHPAPCAKHKEDRSCELEIIAERLGLREPIYTPRASSKGTDFSNPSIAIDHSACILCDRCVRACTDVAHNDVIGRMGKGYGSSISFDDNKPMGTSSCVNCGECMIHCPTGAITYSGGTPPTMDGARLDAKEIQAIPLFKGINREFLRRSEGAVAVRRFNKGDVICRQGEFGSSAFYVDSGSVSIYLEGNESFGHVRTRREGGFFTRVRSMLMSREQDTRREEGQKRYIPIDASSVDLDYDAPLATVGAGELIGEAACLNYQPRSATVIAAEDGTIVFEMLRNVLDILRRNREFKRQMEEKYRQRALENHLRSVAVFRDLPAEFIDSLRSKVELVGFNPGEMICAQGDPADAFYLVRMGHVKVYESFADGQGLVLTYLSRSQYFGEIGLLGGGVRTANCSALDHVECVKIGKAEFDEMVAKFPQIRERLQAEADSRIEQNRQRITQLSRVSLPQYINQGLYQAQSLLILDLEKCTRCDECVRACAQAHDNVTRLVREGLRFDKYLVTTSCRSCRDPYCMVGCPVGSIRRKGDMQILIEDHCIGCGRCAEQCPYGNINMHPFTVNFTDLVTGERKTREGRKAAVCDLCDDQCLGENDEPSCVYACPHDAAHRVDGQTFFDDLVRGSGGAAAGK